jgi:hypothetical protein
MTMTTQYRSGPATSFSLAGFLLALIMGAALLGVFVHRARTGLAGRVATLITGRTSAFDESVPVVVEHIQSLNRLETVVYSLDTVVENAKSSPILPDALAGDKILLVVHGQAVAGIDLSRLKPEDVRIDPPDLNGTPSRSIHVTLPPSEIFNVSLDNTKTRVFARETGLLVPADQNLESDTRAKAQQELQAAALSDGILDAARKNARAAVEMLLSSLGFTHVEVT